MRKSIEVFRFLFIFIVSLFGLSYSLFGFNARAKQSEIAYINDEFDIEKALDNHIEKMYFCKDVHLKSPIKIDYSIEMDLQYFKIYIDDDFIEGKKAAIIIDGEESYITADLLNVVFRNGIIYNKNMTQEYQNVGPSYSYGDGKEGEKGMDTIWVSFARLRLENCSVYGGNGGNGGDGSLARRWLLFDYRNGGDGGKGGNGGAAVVLKDKSIVEVCNSWLIGGSGGSGGNGGDSKMGAYSGNGGNGGDGGSSVIIKKGFLNIIDYSGAIKTKLQAGNGGSGGNKGSNRDIYYEDSRQDGIGGKGGDAVCICRLTYSKIEGADAVMLVPGFGGTSKMIYGKNGIGIRDI